MTYYAILAEPQAMLLPLLAPTRALGFALYGGTAIALQLGHRESIDFDFFSAGTLDEAQLIGAMPVLGQATTIRREPETWTVQVFPASNMRPVTLSFFGGIGFGRVGDPVATARGELIMASLADLLGHKLKVLLQRVEAKDYQDIAALIRGGFSIESGLGAARALFASFPVADALRALTWFDGGDLDRLSSDDRVLLASAAAGAGIPEVVKIAARELAG